MDPLWLANLYLIFNKMVPGHHAHSSAVCVADVALQGDIASRFNR